MRGIEKKSEKLCIKEKEDYLLNHRLDNKWFEGVFTDDMRFYAESAASEAVEKVLIKAVNSDNEHIELFTSNRLVKELAIVVLLKIGEDISENGEIIDCIKVIDKYCDYYDSPEKKGYKDAVDWYRSQFGEEALYEVVKDLNLVV